MTLQGRSSKLDLCEYEMSVQQLSPRVLGLVDVDGGEPIGWGRGGFSRTASPAIGAGRKGAGAAGGGITIDGDASPLSGMSPSVGSPISRRREYLPPLLFGTGVSLLLLVLLAIASAPSDFISQRALRVEDPPVAHGPPTSAPLSMEEVLSVRRMHVSLMSHAGFATPEDRIPRGALPPNTPPPTTFNTCPVDPAQAPLHYTHTGRRCVLPYLHQGTWHFSPSSGRCATLIKPTGEAEVLESCDPQQKVSADTACVRVENASRCGRGGGGGQGLGGCSVAAEKGSCVCEGKLGVVRHAISNCVPTVCSDVCQRIVEDVMSTSHAASLDAAPSELVKHTAMLAQKHTPSRDSLKSWRDYAAQLPSHDSAKRMWCGRGIVIMAGSVDTLPQALATVSFIREHLNSNMPVEIWQAASEVTRHSEEFLKGLQQLGAVLRTLPAEAHPPTAKDMFSLKPAAILASSFDEVLFLDSDALPLVDPISIFEERIAANTTAVFWPDYWTLFYDAKIWDAIGGWPYGDSKHAPSQESGLMVVCKSCGAWRALAVSFFFNYHSTVYYPAIYVGHYNETICWKSKCTQGGRHNHVMPGMGDKDTFQIGHRAVNVSFKMMPPSVLLGPMLPMRGLVCGTSIVHRGAKGLIALHHNSNKWWWRDYRSGEWAERGLQLSHIMAFKNDSSAYHSDGVNEWGSVTYNWREDAGAQKTPEGTRWCIVYKGETVVTEAVEAFGYNVESAILHVYEQLYDAPWVVDWVLANTKQVAPKPPRLSLGAAVFLALCTAGLIAFIVWDRWLKLGNLLRGEVM